MSRKPRVKKEREPGSLAASKRAGDFLEPITKDRKPEKFGTIDIESKADDTQRAGFTRPFLVGFYDASRMEYREYRDEPHLLERAWHRRHSDPGGCIDKLLATILQKRFNNYVWYAHNGGGFDWLFLLVWLQEHRDEYAFELIPVQSSIQVIRVWRVPEDPEQPIRERWEFRDSMKLLPMGLDKACTAFGLPSKLKHDLHMHEDDPRWSAYLKQDCIALAGVLLRFYALIERLGGEVGITTPACAMKLFRKQYIGRDGVPAKIARHAHWPDCPMPDACDGCMHSWIRRGYYGGRTEIHRFLGTGLHYFDINSSYVATMKEEMPIGDRVIDEGKLDWRRHTSQGGHNSGFCECTVYIPPTCPIPPLPHRAKKTGKLIFPTGTFHGVWSVEELRLLEHPLVGGRILKVERAVWFGLRPMFGKMVESLWKLRDKSLPGYDEGLSLLAKLLGNSTYGKFAMRQDRSSVVFSHDEFDEFELEKKCFLCAAELVPRSEGEPVRRLCLDCEGSKPAMPDADGNVWYQKQKVDVPYIIPHVAAHITALARVRLWDFMRQAIETPAEGKQRQVRDLEPGDVFLMASATRPPQAAVVLGVKLSSRKGHASVEVRTADAEGRSMDGVVELRRSALVQQGGTIFYLDTDSIITDVMLPQSTELGALKDEYPDETLDYLAVQPKVYVIERVSKNRQIQAKNDEDWRARYEHMLSRAWVDPDSVDPLELARPWADPDSLRPKKLHEPKVTMKGFPRDLRTRENLDKLRDGKMLEWERLEKVRTLARLGFRRGPRMADVKKSFRSAYDKRVATKDGGTRPIVLDEPLGGYPDLPPTTGFEADDESDVA